MQSPKMGTSSLSLATGQCAWRGQEGGGGSGDEVGKWQGWVTEALEGRWDFILN